MLTFDYNSVCALYCSYQMAFIHEAVNEVKPNFGTSRLCVTVSVINVLYYFVQPTPRLSKIGRTKRLS